MVLEAWWVTGPVRTGAENLTTSWFDPQTVQPTASRFDMLQNVVRVFTTAILRGEVSTRIYESNKRMAELITNWNAKAMAQHIHSSVTRHFNEAIIIVTAWSGDRNPVGARFPHPSRPVLGPAQSPIQWGPGSTGGWGWKRQGRGINHTPTFSAEVKERVEL